MGPNDRIVAVPQTVSLDLSAAVAFAHRLADESGDALLQFFRDSLPVEDKGAERGFDPVTEADRQAEQVMRNMVVEAFPDHGIIGEEFDPVASHAALRWVFDPIDGTRAFIMGSPMWGTLIGLLNETEPVIGLMNQPFTGERFWADDSAAYFRHGRANAPARHIKTRKCGRLDEATLTTTDPLLFGSEQEKAAFDVLAGHTRLTRYGGDCYNYCLLAAGFVDLVVESGLKPHDVVALIPIIERAGGVMTTWEGAPATDGGRIIAAGDKGLHEKAMKMLSETA